MNKSSKLAAISLVAILAGIVIFLAMRQPPSQGSSQAPSSEAIEQEKVPSQSSSGNMVTDGAMPSVNQPLRQTIGQLKLMADNGNATAACRIAAEYQFCAGAQSRADRLDDIAMEQGADGSPVAIIRQADPNLPNDSTHCDGVEVATSEQIVSAWRRAAEMGNINAMTNYAVGHAFESQNFLNNLDELKLYKQNAEKYAARSAESGDGGALLALAAAYAPQTHQLMPSMLTQAVDVNLQRSLALYSLALRRIPSDSGHAKLRKYVEEKIEVLKRYANDEQINAASSEATSLHSKWKETVFPSEGEIAALDRGRVRPLKMNACPDDNF